jgi:hypothetical protein
MSYKVEIRNCTGLKWSANRIRLATRQEAESYGFDLASRWMAASEYRITESTDPVNFTWGVAGLQPVKGEQA